MGIHFVKMEVLSKLMAMWFVVNISGLMRWKGLCMLLGLSDSTWLFILAMSVMLSKPRIEIILSHYKFSQMGKQKPMWNAYFNLDYNIRCIVLFKLVDKVKVPSYSHSMLDFPHRKFGAKLPESSNPKAHCRLPVRNKNKPTNSFNLNCNDSIEP